MNRLALSFAICLLVIGCQSKDSTEEPSNVVEALPSDPAAIEHPLAAPVGEADPQPGTVEAAAQAEGESAPAEGESAPAGGESAQARDLAAELRTAVGSPADCIKDYQPGTAMTIPISINAIVRPSGLIIEPSASGRGLSNNDRRCIEQRVGAVVLSPLAGLGSVPVSTTVNVQYQPPTAPTIKEYDVGGPAPNLKDVVEPLPQKKPIERSGVPIDGPKGDPIEGPQGDPIQGPKGDPVEGPKPVPIDGYEVDQDAERWTD